MMYKKIFLTSTVIILLLSLTACGSDEKQSSTPEPAPEKVLTGNVFIDAEISNHFTKTEVGTVVSGYSRIDFETAKAASMEDFIDFAFNEVKSHEQYNNWFTIEFLNDKGGTNGKGICFFGCNPYTVQYGEIAYTDGSIHEALGNLIYNEETASYEYEALETEE